MSASGKPLEGLRILDLSRVLACPFATMIMAELSGHDLEKLGVVAGMSGSPIFVDGKLIGALSTQIGQFSPDAICGITPIQSMLDIRHVPPAPPVPIGGASVSTKAFLSAFTSGDFASRLEALVQPDKKFRGDHRALNGTELRALDLARN